MDPERLPCIKQLGIEKYRESDLHKIAYINFILHHHGQEVETEQELYRLLNRPLDQLFESFVKKTGFGLETKITQLVQMLTCEETLTETIEGKRKGWRTNRAQKTDENWSLLAKIQKTEFELAKKIFTREGKADRVAHNLDKLRKTYFSHMYDQRKGISPDAKKVERNKAMLELANKFVRKRYQLR